MVTKLMKAKVHKNRTVFLENSHYTIYFKTLVYTHYIGALTTRESAFGLPHFYKGLSTVAISHDIVTSAVRVRVAVPFMAAGAESPH